MSFTPIGDTGYGIAHAGLSNEGDGNHRLTADAPVGMSVYGVMNYGSYWYPVWCQNSAHEIPD